MPDLEAGQNLFYWADGQGENADDQKQKTAEAAKIGKESEQTENRKDPVQNFENFLFVSHFIAPPYEQTSLLLQLTSVNKVF